MLLGLACSSISTEGPSKYWGENTYKKVKEFGYSAIDCGILGKASGTAYTSDPETKKKFLLHEKALIEDAGLFINQAHAPCISKPHPLAQEEISGLLETLKVAIDSCQVLNCKNLVLHPFMPYGWEGRNRPLAVDNFNRNVEYLTQLSDFAKDYDVTLCLETLPCLGFSISTPDEVAEVVRAVDRENVKMCFDTGHITAFSHTMKVDEELRKCGDLVKVLHVHDNYGRADQHIFPGLGMTNWANVMTALKEINYNGVFSLELNFPNRFAEPLFERFCRLITDMAKDIVDGKLI